MPKTIRRLSAALLTAWALAGCAQKPYAPELVTPEAVQARVARGEAVLLADVRKPASYRAEHIDGAVSFPAARLAEGRVALPKDRWIVLYCT